jgi:hypothetical protein
MGGSGYRYAGGTKKSDDSRTTFTKLPEHEGIQTPTATSKLLEAVKAQLGKLTIQDSASDLVWGERADGSKGYTALPKRLLGAWKLDIQGTTFLVGQTRSTWVLLYDKPPEMIYEDTRFMSIDLKRKDIVTTEKGKRMYVSRIERADLDRLNGIAAQEARKRTVVVDTLVPQEGSFSMPEVREKLLRCEFRQSTDPFFDLESFVKSIKFMTPMQGATGNYYYIVAGDEEKTCALYIDRPDPIPKDSYKGVAILKYRGKQSEDCILFMDIS